jgi:autotransporter-associated beta strand protein
VTFREGSNIDFAGKSGSSVVAATYTSGLPTSGSTSTVNYTQADNASVTASQSANALKLTTTTSGQALTIDAGQTLTLTSGGLLFTGADAYSITGGTLKSNTATNSDLIVHQYGAGNLSISSEIANGVGASTLTKTGTGTLVLGTANTYTGQTFVNGGTLSISNNNQLGAIATGARLHLHGGGILQATADVTLNNAGSNSRPITIGSGGGGFDVTGSNTLTVTGQITADGQITKSGAGTLTLSSDNFVWGGLRIDEGTVRLNAASALTAFSNARTAITSQRLR